MVWAPCGPAFRVPPRLFRQFQDEVRRIHLLRTRVDRGREIGLILATLDRDRWAPSDSILPDHEASLLRRCERAPPRKLRSIPREPVRHRYRPSHRHLPQAQLVQHYDAAWPRGLDETGLPELTHGLGDGFARARNHAREVVVAQAYPHPRPPATLLPEALCQLQQKARQPTVYPSVEQPLHCRLALVGTLGEGLEQRWGTAGILREVAQ